MNPPIIRTVGIQFPPRGQGPRVTIQDFMWNEGLTVAFRTPKDMTYPPTLGFTHVSGFPSCFRRYTISETPNDFDGDNALWADTTQYLALRLYVRPPVADWPAFKADTPYFLMVDNTYSMSSMPRLDGFISVGISTRRAE